MMKKFCSCALLVLLAVVMSVGLASCDDDDNARKSLSDFWDNLGED